MAEPLAVGPGMPGTLPVSTAPRGFTPRLALANLGLWMALLTPVLVTMALRVGQVDPAGKEASLGLVLGVGALLAMVGNPLFGRLSDRTVSRFGRRRRARAGGVIGGTAGLAVIALVPSIPAILLGWCLAQLSFNATLAAMTAVIPDQVSEEHRGSVSGLVGAAQPAAIILGSLFAATFADSATLQFLLPAALCVIVVAYFALTLKDKQGAAAREPFSLKEFAGSFWVNPMRHPNFGWAWFTRFLVMLGVATPISYLAFFLPERAGVAEADVAQVIFLCVAVCYGITAVVAPLGGWLSDRTGTRKPFVIGSAAVLALGLALLAIATSLPMVLVAEVVLGVGSGLFFAVDLALITLVLPSTETVAKDLGVINIANALPQSIAPAIAPFILAIGGGKNYTALFMFAAISAIVGAVLVTRIKGVR